MKHVIPHRETSVTQLVWECWRTADEQELLQDGATHRTAGLRLLDELGINLSQPTTCG